MTSPNTSPKRPAARPEPPAACRFEGDSLILSLWLKPQAKYCRLKEVGTDYLRIEVQAPPLEGRANQALIEYLSEIFHCPRQAIALIKGQSSRRKVVRIKGRREQLAAYLRVWLAL